MSRPPATFLAPILFEAGSHPRDRTLNPLKVNSDDVRKWIEARDPKATGHWQELGAEEYARAFTAARTAGAGVVDDLYYALADTFSRGGTVTDYENLVTPILRAKGWLPDLSKGQLASRVRLIYDTNLRLARSSGQWARYWGTRHALPYLRGVTARDERVRHPPKSKSDHRAWDGIILPIEHPFWRRWWTPLGFRCRCSVIQMTRSQLSRYGGGVTSEEELAGREARLGTPIFASPGVGIAAQLAGMTEAANEGLMPGLPPANPVTTGSQGAALWSSILSHDGHAAILAILTGLFAEDAAAA